MEGLAADEVGGNLGEELRHQGAERFGILVVGEAVAFEGAGDEGFMDLRFDPGGVATILAETGNRPSWPT